MTRCATCWPGSATASPPGGPVHPHARPRRRVLRPDRQPGARRPARRRPPGDRHDHRRPGHRHDARRELKHTLRYPLMLIASIISPVVMLLLFVYILGGPIGAGLGSAARGAPYVDYLVPGILVMTVASGTSTTAINVCTDMTGGIIDRFRTMAVSRGALLTGHVVGNVLRTMVNTVVRDRGGARRRVPAARHGPGLAGRRRPVRGVLVRAGLAVGRARPGHQEHGRREQLDPADPVPAAVPVQRVRAGRRRCPPGCAGSPSTSRSPRWWTPCARCCPARRPGIPGTWPWPGARGSRWPATCGRGRCSAAAAGEVTVPMTGRDGPRRPRAGRRPPRMITIGQLAELRRRDDQGGPRTTTRAACCPSRRGTRRATGATAPRTRSASSRSGRWPRPACRSPGSGSCSPPTPTRSPRRSPRSTAAWPATAAELRRSRERIAQLSGGDRLFVSAEIADFLGRLREIGVSAARRAAGARPLDPAAVGVAERGRDLVRRQARLASPIPSSRPSTGTTTPRSAGPRTTRGCPRWPGGRTAGWPPGPPGPAGPRRPPGRLCGPGPGGDRAHRELGHGVAGLGAAGRARPGAADR